VFLQWTKKTGLSVGNPAVSAETRGFPAPGRPGCGLFTTQPFLDQAVPLLTSCHAALLRLRVDRKKPDSAGIGALPHSGIYHLYKALGPVPRGLHWTISLWNCQVFWLTDRPTNRAFPWELHYPIVAHLRPSSPFTAARPPGIHTQFPWPVMVLSFLDSHPSRGPLGDPPGITLWLHLLSGKFGAPRQPPLPSHDPGRPLDWPKMLEKQLSAINSQLQSY